MSTTVNNLIYLLNILVQILNRNPHTIAPLTNGINDLTATISDPLCVMDVSSLSRIKESVNQQQTNKPSGSKPEPLTQILIADAIENYFAEGLHTPTIKLLRRDCEAYPLEDAKLNMNNSNHFYMCRSKDERIAKFVNHLGISTKIDMSKFKSSSVGLITKATNETIHRAATCFAWCSAEYNNCDECYICVHRHNRIVSTDAARGVGNLGKIRNKRASGGVITKYRSSELVTFWAAKKVPQDIYIAPGRFYGSGLIVGSHQVLVSSSYFDELDFTGNKSLPLVFGDSKNSLEVDVEAGVKADRNGRTSRYYRLKKVADFARHFYLLRREMNDHKEDFDWMQDWEVSPPFADDVEGPKDCFFVGWSRNLDNGTKKENTLYLVEIPVTRVEGPIRRDVYDFYKSDGKPGGFCNTYAESGNLIYCSTNKNGYAIEYITIQDPTAEVNPLDCNSNVTAVRVASYGYDIVDLVTKDEVKRKEGIKKGKKRTSKSDYEV